jgi:hypothetical protein
MIVILFIQNSIKILKITYITWSFYHLLQARPLRCQPPCPPPHLPQPSWWPRPIHLLARPRPDPPVMAGPRPLPAGCGLSLPSRQFAVRGKAGARFDEGKGGLVTTESGRLSRHLPRSRLCSPSPRLVRKRPYPVPRGRCPVRLCGEVDRIILPPQPLTGARDKLSQAKIAWVTQQGGVNNFKTNIMFQCPVLHDFFSPLPNQEQFPHLVLDPQNSLYA